MEAGAGSRPAGLRSQGALWRSHEEGRDSAGAGLRARQPLLFDPGVGLGGRTQAEAAKVSQGRDLKG